MKYLKAIFFVLVLCTIIFVCNRAFTPEHRYFDGYEENYMQTGKGFSKLPKYCLDVIFLGSSNVFMNVSPVDLYNEYGYKAYDLATPMQTLEESFFQLYEAFKTQMPSVVALDCLAFERYDDNGEAYTHMAYDAYPLTFFKNQWLEDNLAENYDFESFQVPFLLYHNRFDEMDVSDFDLQYYNGKEDFLGYAPAFSTVSSENYGLKEGHPDAQFTEEDRYFLEEIMQLCKENYCELVLFKTPCVGSWFKEDSVIMKEVAQKYGLQYWEFSENPTIDKENDFCDGGGHLNDNGAKKMTRAIGDKLYQLIGESDIASDDEKNYFDERVYNLGKCRDVQELKYENDFSQICNKIVDEDYVVFINANINSEGILEPLQKLIKFVGDVDLMQKGQGQYMSMIFDRAQSIAHIIDGEDDTVWEGSMYGHDIYIENSLKNGSIIQVDYNNYSYNHNDADIFLVIYDKYYDCVIDSMSIWITEEGVVTSHI